MPDLTNASCFVLEIDGIEIGAFRKCSKFESENEIIEYKESTKEGRMIIRKVPGAIKWADITLEGRLEATPKLWEWRKLVEEGKIDKARRTGSIVAKNSEGKEVARWDFENGWASKLTGPDLDATSSEIATASLNITHEGIRPA